MAVHTEQQKQMQGGIAKEINSAAMEMILDNLQRSQYQFPIKSTVREIISNGVDSISEKIMALQILTGQAVVEDFFEEREGDVYKDSHFDPEYYDQQWLSDDKQVYMTYICGSPMEKDRVEFRDNGVGLGSGRLKGYFQIGFSSKRLSRLPLGKFGAGGKSPLATGVDFFTMESRYNGKKFKFNVYNASIDSIIPERGNDHILFGEHKVYYETTTEKNGVTVSLQVKKNHKQQYIDAVKSQLLHIDNIKFTVVEEDGSTTPVKYGSNILYEDDRIVLSDNQYYSKPYLILNKVVYGYINFEELELEEKVGNIGIKMAPEELDINPSRESVIWSEKTKQMVLSRFESVVDIATRLLQQELRESDYLRWLRSCYAITNRFFAGDSVVARLAKIVDLQQIKPAFDPNPKLKFSSASNLGGLYIRTTELSREIVANRTKTRVKRKEMKNIQTVIDKPIYLMKKDERANNRKDKWLLNGVWEHGHTIFVTITEPMTHEEMKLIGMSEEWIDALTTAVNKAVGEETNNRYQTWDALVSSQDVVWYEDVEVPEEFKATDDDEVEEKESKDKKIKEEKEKDKNEVKITAAERRKAERKILLYTPRAGGLSDMLDPNNPAVPGHFIPNPNYDPSIPSTITLTTSVPTSNPMQLYVATVPAGVIGQKAYEWQKIEIPIKDMNDWTEEEIYYSDGQDELMHFAAMLSRDRDPLNEIGDPRRRMGTSSDTGNHGTVTWQSKKYWKDHGEKLRNDLKLNAHEMYRCQNFFDTEVKLIKSSRPNHKYLRDFRTIDRFFLTVNNKTITMSNLLIRWNTARLIKEKLESCRFLYNFGKFNPKYSNLYRELTDYALTHYREVVKNVNDKIYGLSPNTYLDMISHLDKVKLFQDFVASKPAPEELSEMAVHLFGNPELQDGMAVDPDIMKKFDLVHEFSNGCGTLFNHIGVLTAGGYISDELEMEIKQYLDFKGMLNYQTEAETEEADYKGLEGPEVVVDDSLTTPVLEEEETYTF